MADESYTDEQLKKHEKLLMELFSFIEKFPKHEFRNTEIDSTITGLENADKLLVNLEKGNKEEGDKNIYFKLRILNDQKSTILGRKPNWHISFHDPDFYKGKKKVHKKKV